MSELETTGMQNPIFQIINGQNQWQQGQQMNQNPMNLNQNSNVIGQMGMQNQMDNPMMNQNMNINNQMNNLMNNQMNQMGQDNDIKNNHMMRQSENNMMNNINQISMMGNPMIMNQGMNPILQQINMMHQQMDPQMGFWMDQFQMGIQPNLIKIKEDLSKIYGLKINNIFDSIYNSIKFKKENLKKNSCEMIKINFYDNILEIKLYDKFYVCALIEYIFDEIFGENYEKVYFGERKYEFQTTQDVIQNPIIEIIKFRENDYSDYLFLEYKGKDLNELKNKTCKEIGLTCGNEIILKFKKNLNNELKNEKIINNNKNEEDIERYKKDIINDNMNMNIKKKKNHKYKKGFADKQIINVIFKLQQGEKNNKDNNMISLQVEEDKSISDLIEQYLDEIGRNFEEFTRGILIFLYNSENLLKYSDKSLRMILENPNTIIHVVDNSDMYGAGHPPFDFVDVTSNKVKLKKVIEKSYDLSKKWREIYKGLNIFGICQNNKCEVKGKEVIYKIKLKKEGLCFNINEERENIKCPMCGTKFKKKTCGFWKCEYQFVGVYYDYEKGKNIEYNSEPHETPTDKFEYFDPEENGSREWDELIIFVLPRQEIKYKK